MTNDLTNGNQKDLNMIKVRKSVPGNFNNARKLNQMPS